MNVAVLEGASRCRQPDYILRLPTVFAPAAVHPTISRINLKGTVKMRKLTMVSAAGLALLAGVSLLTLVPGRDAAAQSRGAYINLVELDIDPGETAKFIEAIKENGAGSVKEPGCREFNVSVLASNPNHVVLYEVYDNEAALAAHRTTDHFKKYQAATAKMVVGRNVRALTGIAFN
ncbi:MAG TPA: putative quinol monooxygenase, partial [Burkholderiales bacterium]|nr:putative quinol monooxygenase [Burkholderiales bacterium]